jgi:hypothetical protein
MIGSPAISAGAVESSASQPPTGLPCRTIGVRWSSIRPASNGKVGANTAHFILGVQIESADSAIVEAWVRDANHECCVLPRQHCSVCVCEDNGMMHVEVFGKSGGSSERIASLSIFRGQVLDQERLAYAHSSLLSRAGFTAGTYDPPRLLDEYPHIPSPSLA